MGSDFAIGRCWGWVGNEWREREWKKEKFGEFDSAEFAFVFALAVCILHFLPEEISFAWY